MNSLSLTCLLASLCLACLVAAQDGRNCDKIVYAPFSFSNCHHLCNGEGLVRSKTDSDFPCCCQDKKIQEQMEARGCDKIIPAKWSWDNCRELCKGIGMSRNKDDADLPCCCNH